jgi:hypothetical protein
MKLGIEVQMPATDRKVSRRNWRMVNVVETMHNDGKIDDRRWSAWQRFQRDWVASERAPSVIQKYGDRFGSGGTPEWQMAADAFTMADERMKFRIDQIDRLRNALEAVSAPNLQVALVMAAACECSLEDIGRKVSWYGDRGKAIAVAASMLDTALWLLHCHYQALYGQSSKAP